MNYTGVDRVRLLRMCDVLIGGPVWAVAAAIDQDAWKGSHGSGMSHSENTLNAGARSCLKIIWYDKVPDEPPDGEHPDASNNDEHNELGLPAGDPRLLHRV